MPDRTPLVSVVMSVYNDGPFVNEAVASIWGQSFGGFGFIIVDDGWAKGQKQFYGGT